MARREFGYGEGLVAVGRARGWTMRTALPSKSLALYETIHTSLVPAKHGITTNDVVRRSRWEHVFVVARRHDRRTTVTAHAWMAELYLPVRFDRVQGCEVGDEEGAIQHDRFYPHDDTPDPEVLWAEEIRHWRHARDYLPIHTMACDWIGHRHGAKPLHYARAASQLDDMLARLVPAWLEDGHVVLLTTDHGMDRHGWYGDTGEDVRSIPFYAIGAGAPGETGKARCQTMVAPMVLALMGLPRPAAIRARPLQGEVAEAGRDTLDRPHGGGYRKPARRFHSSARAHADARDSLR